MLGRLAPATAMASSPARKESAEVAPAAVPAELQTGSVTRVTPDEPLPSVAAPVPPAPKPDAPDATIAAALGEVRTARSNLATPAGTSTATPDKAIELLAKINEARQHEGLPVLVPDPDLERVASIRADDLVKNAYFAHYSPDGRSAFSELAARGITYRLAGENLARNNFPDAKTVDEAFAALMASPGHRANLLEPRFANAGVIAIRTGPLVLYVTVFKD